MTQVCRIYLGQGVERDVFKELFVNHIEDKYLRRKLKSLRIIWDYDINELNMKRLSFAVIKPSFINIRSLVEGKSPVKVDVLFIDEFYKVPKNAQYKIIKGIQDGKFESMLILLDKKSNINKYDDDFLDLLKHYNVKAKSS